MIIYNWFEIINPDVQYWKYIKEDWMAFHDWAIDNNSKYVPVLKLQLNEIIKFHKPNQYNWYVFIPINFYLSPFIRSILSEYKSVKLVSHTQHEEMLLDVSIMNIFNVIADAVILFKEINDYH